MRLSTHLALVCVWVCPALGLAAESAYSAFDVTVVAHGQGAYWAYRESSLCRSESGESFLPVAVFPETPHTVVPFPNGVAVAAGSQIFLHTGDKGPGKPVAQLGDAAGNLTWYPTAQCLAAWFGPQVWLADSSGQTWSAFSVSADPSASLSGLMHERGRWLAHGSINQPSSDGSNAPKPAIWSSPDGHTWSLSTVPHLPDAAAFKALIPNAPLWVFAAVDDQGEVDGEAKVFLRLWTSADGVTWSSLEAPADLQAPWQASLASGPVGLLLAEKERLWRLGAGGTWEALPSLTSEAGQFLSSGESLYWLISDSFVRRSADGVTWREQALQPGWWFRRLSRGTVENEDPIVAAHRRDSTERSAGRLSSYLLE